MSSKTPKLPSSLATPTAQTPSVSPPRPPWRHQTNSLRAPRTSASTSRRTPSHLLPTPPSSNRKFPRQLAFPLFCLEFDLTNIVLRASNEQKQSITVQKTLKAAKGTDTPQEEIIHWGGGLHQRQNFNKKKDPIVNWTEVLFRNWKLKLLVKP